jgi:hypothetical protein
MRVHRQLAEIQSELASIRVALHTLANDRRMSGAEASAVAESIHRLALAVAEATMART